MSSRFERVSVLGSGGHARVWQVHDHRLGVRRALKVPKVRDQASAERLLREGRLQARVTHPHALPVLEVVEAFGTIGLLMPVVEGPTLKGLLEWHAPPEGEVAALLILVVGALRAAHRAGVVHRDIKPANVLLQRRDGRLHPYLADFGLAAHPDEADLLPDGGFAGTMGFAAPEQMADANSAGPAADAWGIGAMMCWMLVGARPPSSARGAAAWRTSHLPQGWKDLMTGLLRDDPSTRLSLDELVRRLGPMVTELPRDDAAPWPCGGADAPAQTRLSTLPLQTSAAGIGVSSGSHVAVGVKC